MYSLHDYARMIADGARMDPYVRALEAVVRADSVVADVGTGTGILALVACRLGAKRVFAIDANDALEVGRELARENGYADRIVFFQKDVSEVELPERADVVVSDLRGSFPLFGDHLAIVEDVRARFLKPGGVLMPARDRLMVAVVERPDLYAWAIGPERGPLDLTLRSLRDRLRNAPVSDRTYAPLEVANVVSTTATWATLEYATSSSGPVFGRAALQIKRACTGHGIAVWFEAIIADQHGFSSGPDEPVSCYKPLFLPWPRPVRLRGGDTVTVDLWAQANGDPWGWNSSVPVGLGERESFKQSSFLSCPGRPSASPGMRGATFVATGP